MTQGNFFTGTTAGGDTLTVTDGTTTNTDVRKIIVSAGTITASSGHTVTVTTGGGGGAGVTTIGFGTTGLTPAGATGGVVTVAGTLVVSNGGTGATTLTDNSVLTGTGTSPITAESKLTFDGSTLALTGDQTYTGSISGGTSLGATSFTSIGTVGAANSGIRNSGAEVNIAATPLTAAPAPFNAPLNAATIASTEEMYRYFGAIGDVILADPTTFTAGTTVTIIHMGALGTPIRIQMTGGHMGTAAITTVTLNNAPNAGTPELGCATAATFWIYPGPTPAPAEQMWAWVDVTYSGPNAPDPALLPPVTVGP